jgi:hypothetical protein
MADKFTPAPSGGFALGTSVTAVSTGHYPPTPQETFEEWLKKNVREFPATLDLPADLLQWIAKIVTYWAVVEWIQLGTLARLLGIERKEARVMFGARIGNSVSKIKQLLEMKNIRSPEYMSSLSASLTECEGRRNLVGHGVWMNDQGELCVENPSGDWIHQPHANVSKRKYPQAFYPTPIWLAETLENIKSAIRSLQKLDLEIDAAFSASPH